MYGRIALILLFSATTISARSIEGLGCREYPVVTGDPFTPLRTVRVCGSMQEYEAAPNYFPTPFEGQVRRSLPSDTLYGRDSIWTRPAFQQSPIRWPSPSQSYNNDREQFPQPVTQLMQLFPHALETFKKNDWNSNNPSINNNELNSRNQMEVDHLLQKQMNFIVDDVSEVKDSVKNLVAYLKDILDTLHMQNELRRNEENINVNLKLDPSLEALLKHFLQLIETSTSKEELQIISNGIEEADDNHEDTEDSYLPEASTEDSSEEKITEAPSNTEENSTERDVEEDQIITEGNSLEDVNNWIRFYFGPPLQLHKNEEEIEDLLHKSSEEDNTAEKSDESFESWFNAVYGRVSESKENESNESSENSKEHSTTKAYEDDTSNPFIATEESIEDTDDNDENLDYDTYFVPTTMAPIQEETTAEYLENGGRYGYTTESNSNVDFIKSKEFNLDSCFEIALSLPNFGNAEVLHKYNQCIQALYLSAPDESKETEELKREADSASKGSNESEESKETESSVKGSDESKESKETEFAVTSSDESKESNETESAVTSSDESKESNETESTVTDSDESKESNETESAVTESDESKESNETESAVTSSDESKESGENESAVTDSNESKKSFETNYDEFYGPWVYV
ncbi:early endosome antigen 1-like [Anastrepha ludens]|uniref:early endosome antigen 1-like n=1 Tax=Anastrepha ludens TaxID=28586 RepID=UPI0023AF1E45|nr:early endosome antigen 1-like [Anastrepha ludens]